MIGPYKNPYSKPYTCIDWTIDFIKYDIIEKIRKIMKKKNKKKDVEYFAKSIGWDFESAEKHLESLAENGAAVQIEYPDGTKVLLNKWINPKKTTIEK